MQISGAENDGIAKSDVDDEFAEPEAAAIITGMAGLRAS